VSHQIAARGQRVKRVSEGEREPLHSFGREEIGQTKAAGSGVEIRINLTTVIGRE
jgi:hypothetical protein